MTFNSKEIRADRSTGTGREKHDDVPIRFPQTGLDNHAGLIGVLEEEFSVGDFTDGGSTTGTYQMAGAIPKGAVVLGAKVLVSAGFAGDTTATMQIGDGSDVDRYSTGTPSVFATAADGIQIGVPSGTKLLTSANRPTITVTGGADFTSVTPGTMKVSIFYIDA